MMDTQQRSFIITCPPFFFKHEEIAGLVFLYLKIVHYIHFCVNNVRYMPLISHLYHDFQVEDILIKGCLQKAHSEMISREKKYNEQYN